MCVLKRSTLTQLPLHRHTEQTRTIPIWFSLLAFIFVYSESSDDYIYLGYQCDNRGYWNAQQVNSIFDPVFCILLIR